MLQASVQNQFEPSGGRVPNADPDFTITYNYQRDGGKIHIFPEAPYLSLLEQGGPVSGVRAWWSAFFAWQFPKLSVKMVNNTASTVLVTEAAIEVRESSINTDPVIIIDKNPYKVGYLSIINEGWGEVLDPKLKLQIAPANSGGFASATLPRHEAQVQSFLEEAKVPIDSYVPPELRGERAVAVFGELEYRTESHNERWLRFRTEVSLTHPGLGAPAPPNFLYELFLQAGMSKITKNLPLSQQIAPGETDHFLIRIGTDKSARFDLMFSFRTAGGARLPEVPVLLDVFLPRTQAGKTASRP